MVPWSKTNSQTQDVDSYQNGKVPQDKKEALKREKTDEESKESFQLALGTYRACVVPLSILFFGYGCGLLAVAPMNEDPRVGDWFLMQKSWVCLLICIFYVLFSITWGPRLMKNREPLKLRKLMIYYNAFQVVLSAYMFFEVGMAGWFFDYNYRCQPCDYSYTSKAMRIASVGWLFFISKIIDFMDTLFFILNKKWNHISVLHVVHHSCMCISMWFGIRYTPGGHITFMGFLNSGVHSIMYAYYFLSAFGPRMKPYLWWKRYLTSIQLIQFVAIFFHAAQSLVFECSAVPVGLPIWTCIYAFIFFVLFVDFYYRAYLYPTQKPTKRKSSTDGLTLIELTNNNEVKGINLQKGDINCNEYLESQKEDKNGQFVCSSSNISSFRIDSCLRERKSNE